MPYFVLHFLTIFLFSSSTFCFDSDGLTNELYRHMVFRASPYAELKGRYPAKIGDIGHGQHFRFYKDANGRTVRIERWFRNGIKSGGYNRFGALASAAIVQFEYGSRSMTRRYLDEQGKPMLNYWGVAEEVFQIDEMGHRTSLIYKDLEGNRISDSREVWETHWDVKENGKIVIERRLGKDGASRRFNNFLDFDRVKMIFDEDSLRLETWNIDEKGMPVNSKKRQVAGVKISWNTDTYDERTIVWVDVKGNPKDLAPFELMPGNYGFSSETYEHDSIGNSTALIKYNSRGSIVTPESDGNVFGRNIFDGYGFLVDRRYFNSTGLPAVTTNGIARIEILRNPTGLPVQIRRYDLSGELVNGRNDGYAVMILKYEDQKERPSITYLNRNGEEVRIPTGQ